MLSVPIKNYLCTGENRLSYLKYFTEAGVDRVFLSVVTSCYSDEAVRKRDFELLRENIEFFRNPIDESGNSLRSFEVGIWVVGIGRAGQISPHNGKHLTKLKCLLSGNESFDVLCPLDVNFRKMYCDYLSELASLHPDILLIEDDFRLWYHDSAMAGCACKLHQREYNNRIHKKGMTNRRLSRKAMLARIFADKPSEYRQVWLELMGDTLRDLANDMRAAVDESDSSVRIALCSCLSTWDLDGVDSIELSKILAGNTKPILRLIGAPYWNTTHAFHTTGLGSLVDIIRWESAMCKKHAPEMELMAEGDPYPRPRYEVPASFLESYHQALTADGKPDILKYMFVYNYEPSYEEGYVRLHNSKAELRKKLSESFADTEAAGIYVFEEIHKLHGMDLEGIERRELFDRFVPASVNFVSRLGLPASFEKTKYTPTTLIFGENAKYISDAELEGNLILDAIAAKILIERGVDIGVRECAPMETPESETSGCPERNHDTQGIGRFFKLTPAENGVEAIGVFNTGEPSMLKYTRKNGSTAVIYAYDMETVNFDSKFMKNYSRREQILSLQKELDLPVCTDEPNIYVICRRNEKKMAVGMWNFGQDIGLAQENIFLGEEYSDIVAIGDGNVHIDKNRVSFDGEIPPYCFGGFVAYKK